MIVIDTSAVIAIAFNEPERQTFIDLVLGQDVVYISAATLLEIRILLRSRADEKAAYFIQELLAAEPFRIAAFDEEMAAIASKAYVSFGKGSGHPAQLNYGDVFSYALAKSKGLPLLYKGNDFSETDIVAVRSDLNFCR